jgi:hypothetical protein
MIEITEPKEPVILPFTIILLGKKCRGYSIDGIDYYVIEDIVGDNILEEGTTEPVLTNVVNVAARVDKKHLKYVGKDKEDNLVLCHHIEFSKAVSDPLKRKEIHWVISMEGLRERLTYLEGGTYKNKEMKEND